MVPFYTALKQMNEEGKFFCRSIVDASVDRGKLHVGVCRKLGCFLAVMCDKEGAVDQFQTVHAWGDVDDFFAEDWEYSARNDLTNYDFPKGELNTYTELEFDVWPTIFEKANNKIHPGDLKSTVRFLFKRRVYGATQFDIEDATCPVFNVEDLENKTVEWLNTLIKRLTDAGKTEGISFVSKARLHLVPGGFQMRLRYFAKETDIQHVLHIPLDLMGA